MRQMAAARQVQAHHAVVRLQQCRVDGEIGGAANMMRRYVRRLPGEIVGAIVSGTTPARRPHLPE